MAEVLPLYATPQGVKRQVHAYEAGRRASDQDRYTVVGRRSLLLEPHSRVSFDTYYNRVHAGYYARWSRAEWLTLRLLGTGSARVTVRHSTREGRQIVDQIEVVELSNTTAHTCEVALETFVAGGALWFEVESLADDVVLQSADWVAEIPDVPEPVVDVAICTFNRPADVLKVLRTLKADADFVAHLGTIWVADNGSQSFLELEGADELVNAWGNHLEVLHQPNLGGSGGFSRGMYESINRGAADYVFLMDDDALAEPESLRRAVVFAEIAKEPIAVGGHMLLRGKPLELHSSGERVNGRTFRWGAAPLGQENIRLDQAPLDRVVDVGYNGWWLCLIPTAAIRELGLAQPFFIKWDDAEYGMRLAQAGYLTVTLPGVATWHESWELKDDTTDWTLYFHIRNRLVAAAMLSRDLPEDVAKTRFNAIVRDVLASDVLRNVARRAFSSVDAANQAMEDFLSGPEFLARPLDEVVAEVRANRKRFPGDEQVEAFTSTARLPRDPQPRPKKSWRFVRALAREFGLDIPLIPLPIPPSLVKPKAVSDDWDIWRGPVDRGPTPLPKAADYWWGLTDYPDAAVISIDGSKAVRRHRDPDVARKLTQRALKLARRVRHEGPGLVAAYGDARQTLSTPQAWEKQWNR